MQTWFMCWQEKGFQEKNISFVLLWNMKPNISESQHKLHSQNSSCLIPISLPPKIYNFDIQYDDDVDSLK